MSFALTCKHGNRVTTCDDCARGAARALEAAATAGPGQVPEEIQGWANAVAHGLSDVLPSTWGFGLFICEYGPKAEATDAGGRMYWISSARRDDMVRLLQEWLRRQVAS